MPLDFHENGYAVIPNLIGDQELDDIGRRVDEMPDSGAGTRRLLELPWCNKLAKRLSGETSLSAALPVPAIPVQCTLFVKSTTNNWLVSLHQDLSIPVANRIDSPEYHGWSEKQGGLFVQPPDSVLADMVAVRLHLDDCDQSNGALRVVPGSHRQGRLSSEAATRAKNERGEIAVPVPRGGVMVMKPLLLHASSKASTNNIRRVLHFVFGPARLPDGLRWP